MRKILKNKKLLILIVISIIIALLLIIGTTNIIKRNSKNKKEELTKFTYEVNSFVLNDDCSYTFNVLVIINEPETGIETVKYEKDGKEIVLTCNGKQRAGIDFEAIESKDYEFKIKPVGEKERTEILNIKRKVSGEDTYKEINGVYVNTPFLENFNNKYTRYVYPTQNDKLTPGNWIYDEEPTSWYDYKNGEWANVYVEVEGVEGYYVWIPRYVYKIDTQNSVTGNERMDVKFVDVYNNYKNAETGEVITFKELMAQGYELPEAFEWGEGDITHISGYWISKYQLSELTSYKINYNMSASKNFILVSNFTNNISTATSYTYAINGKIKEIKTTAGDYKFTDLEENASYVVNVTALNENGEILGSMTKVLEPTEVNPPKLDQFDKDTTFYVYWDENGNEINNIPLTKEAPQGWYNYTFAEWANVVTRIDGLETYWVWVPRYQYKLNNTSQRTDVKFIKGTGSEAHEGYIIPEAFWWDANDNNVEEDEEQLTGYWVAKYQMSSEETTASMSAEMSAGSSIIRIKDIIGTKVKDGLKYEYYINGEKQEHEGEDPKEHYGFTNLEPNTTYTINIIAREKESDKYVGAVTKKVKTIEANAPNVKTLSQAQINSASSETNTPGNKTYYVIYEEDNETIKEYIPVTLEGNAPSTWYDYSISRWANILITDGTVNGNQIIGATYTSYFVWVPRYEYRILSRPNEDTSNRRIEVNFLPETSIEKTSADYIIPEAFWWDVNDNGIEDEGEQLTGYWISKYQLR